MPNSVLGSGVAGYKKETKILALVAFTWGGGEGGGTIRQQTNTRTNKKPNTVYVCQLAVLAVGKGKAGEGTGFRLEERQTSWWECVYEGRTSLSASASPGTRRSCFKN